MEEERYYDEYEIDLREYIFLIWNNKWFIIGLFFIGICAAVLISQFYLTPVYETEAVLQLPNMGGIYGNPDAVKQLLKSSNSIKTILDKYDREYSEAELVSYIANNITITSLGDTQIRINVKNTDNKLARKLTLDIISAFKKKAKKPYEKYVSMQNEYIETLKHEIEDINQRINSVNKNIDQIKKGENRAAEKSILFNEQISLLNSLYQQKSDYQQKIQDLKKEIIKLYPVKVLNNPYLPEEPISPNTKLNVAIAGVLALMLGVFIVFFREFLKGETEDK